MFDDFTGDTPARGKTNVIYTQVQQFAIEAAARTERFAELWITFRHCTVSTNRDGTRVGVPSGGARRIRTADQGFADPCLTTWLWRRRECRWSRILAIVARAIDALTAWERCNPLPPPPRHRRNRIRGSSSRSWVRLGGDKAARTDCPS